MLLNGLFKGKTCLEVVLMEAFLGKMSYKVEVSYNYQKVVSSLLRLTEFLWGLGASLADMLSRRVKINCLRGGVDGTEIERN